MKWLSLSVVLSGEYMMAAHSDLLWAICLAVIILVFGITIKVWTRKRDKRMHDIGRGMIYGGLISVSLVAGFAAFLAINP